MPYHKVIDHARDAARIGTTGRGIGPAYEDKARRTGIRVIDLINPGLLRKKIDAFWDERQEYITKILKAKAPDKNELIEKHIILGERLKPFVADASILIDKALKAGKSLLFEGAQGGNLDMDFGTYPYVTSSNTIAGAACTGSGIGPTKIDKVLGICKAYYDTCRRRTVPDGTDGRAWRKASRIRRGIRCNDWQAQKMRLA